MTICRVIVSGFHSPLEQQELRSVIRRSGHAVKVMARGMSEYRPQPDERESLATGRMLIIPLAHRKCGATPTKPRWRATDWRSQWQQESLCHLLPKAVLWLVSWTKGVHELQAINTGRCIS